MTSVCPPRVPKPGARENSLLLMDKIHTFPPPQFANVYLLTCLTFFGGGLFGENFECRNLEQIRKETED